MSRVVKMFTSRRPCSGVEIPKPWPGLKSIPWPNNTNISHAYKSRFSRGFDCSRVKRARRVSGVSRLASKSEIKRTVYASCKSTEIIRNGCDEHCPSVVARDSCRPPPGCLHPFRIRARVISFDFHWPACAAVAAAAAHGRIDETAFSSSGRARIEVFVFAVFAHVTFIYSRTYALYDLRVRIRHCICAGDYWRFAYYILFTPCARSFSLSEQACVKRAGRQTFHDDARRPFSAVASCPKIMICKNKKQFRS